MLNEWVDALLGMINSLSPSAAFIVIVIATFILEDVAIIGTALLASSAIVDPILGGAALLVGIVIGDFGLFWLGRGAARTPVLKRYVKAELAQRFNGLSARRMFSLVFSSRFLPGMRLPTYTALGYVGAPFLKFSQAVVFAVTLWTITLYALIFVLGRDVLNQLGNWKWLVIVAVFGLVIWGERLLARRSHERASHAEG